VKPDVLITAYDLERRSAFFFRSTRARNDPAQDFTLAAAARATSAAPTYFEPALVKDLAGRRSYALVDGGVFAVNPAMCAYAELARGGRAADIAVLASLGTGSHTRPIEYDDAKSWGRLQWAVPILDVVFDGVADTIEFETAQLLPPPRSLRFQTELAEASDNLDDASAANLAALRREAERLIRERGADIDVLCAAVTA
jgi:predicted acylesterase/phospholipase RssA